MESRNLYKDVAGLFGLPLGEQFNITGIGASESPYEFTYTGLHKSGWSYDDNMAQLWNLLNGSCVITKNNGDITYGRVSLWQEIAKMLDVCLGEHFMLIRSDTELSGPFMFTMAGLQRITKTEGRIGQPQILYRLLRGEYCIKKLSERSTYEENE